MYLQCENRLRCCLVLLSAIWSNPNIKLLLLWYEFYLISRTRNEKKNNAPQSTILFISCTGLPRIRFWNVIEFIIKIFTYINTLRKSEREKRRKRKKKRNLHQEFCTFCSFLILCAFRYFWPMDSVESTAFIFTG